MPVFENIQSYLTSPFVYLNDEIEEEQYIAKPYMFPNYM